MSAHSVIVKSKEKARRRRLDVEAVAEQEPDTECDGTCDMCCPDPMAPLGSWEVENAKEELRKRFSGEQA
jgi:hypothetical protein